MTSPAGSPPPLSEGLTRLAALPVEGRTRDDLVRAAVSVCHQTLGPAVELTVHLGPPDQPAVVVSTGRLAQVLDGAQLTAGAGPTTGAFRKRVTVSATVADVPVVAVPLLGAGRVDGVVTAYRSEGAADPAFAGSVEALALGVRALLREAALREEIRRAADDLGRALASRAVIDQAKGIVMAQKGCSAEEAFQHLVDLASTEHVKLRDLAATVVEGVVSRP